MRICMLDNCDKKHDSHGYCANHARQYRRWGRIRTKSEQSKEISERVKKNKPALGKKWSELAKNEQSRRLRGRTLNSGRTHFKVGQESWNKGKKVEAVTGEKNNNWKGDDVSYRNLHRWVERKLGKPDVCSDCGKTGLTGRKIHWSNVSGLYKRELSDWQRLCVKCHKAYDKQLKLAELRG